MRPFQGRSSVTSPGGVAPGYYIVPLAGQGPGAASRPLCRPLRGSTPAQRYDQLPREHLGRCEGPGGSTGGGDARESPKGIHKVAGGNGPGDAFPQDGLTLKGSHPGKEGIGR